MKFPFSLLMVLALVFLAACSSMSEVESTAAPVSTAEITGGFESTQAAVDNSGGPVNDANVNGADMNANLNDSGTPADAPFNDNAALDVTPDVGSTASPDAPGTPALPSTGGTGLPTTPPLGTQAATPEPELPAGAVILFQRSGGIAGVDEAWTVYADGRVIDRSGKATQADPASIAAMVGVVRSAGFFQMQTQYGDSPSPDAYTYILTVRDGDQVHSVTTFDGADNVPPELTLILSQIQSLLGR
ncbi:MAG: hypothetical protein ACKOC5_12650 [Chloroflexota bacterium]